MRRPNILYTNLRINDFNIHINILYSIQVEHFTRALKMIHPIELTYYIQYCSGQLPLDKKSNNNH